MTASSRLLNGVISARDVNTVISRSEATRNLSLRLVSYKISPRGRNDEQNSRNDEQNGRPDEQNGRNDTTDTFSRVVPHDGTLSARAGVFVCLV